MGGKGYLSATLQVKLGSKAKPNPNLNPAQNSGRNMVGSPAVCHPPSPSALATLAGPDVISKDCKNLANWQSPCKAFVLCTAILAQSTSGQVPSLALDGALLEEDFHFLSSDPGQKGMRDRSRLHPDTHVLDPKWAASGYTNMQCSLSAADSWVGT